LANQDFNSKNPMIVDHLNNRLDGGAAIAAIRIHTGLRGAGVDSRFWYFEGDSNSEIEGVQKIEVEAGNPVDVCELPTTFGDRVRGATLYAEKKLGKLKRKSGLEFFSPARTSTRIEYKPPSWKGRILDLHWMARMLDHPTFFANLPDSLPIVWTLHDLLPMTAGCHYNYDCERFTTGCQSCPQLGVGRRIGISERSFEAKLKSLQGKNLHVVANSPWVESQARRSRVLADAKSFRTIYLGIDLNVFKPHDKTTARARWNLPAKGVTIGFGADDLSDRRKGFAVLQRALEQLPTDTPINAVLFGKGEPPSNAPPNVTFHSSGFVSDPAVLAELYSAVDLFVIPSLQEAFGMTGVESLACGTPVVGSDTGGIPSYVKHNETGRLAKPGDAADLANQIAWLVDHPTARATMGENGRHLAKEKFSLATQTQQYLALYQELLSDVAGQPMLSRAG